MKTHELKVWPEFFDALFEGKGFEVRLNDRDYRVGDRLILKWFDPKTQTFNGRHVDVDVCYVLPLSSVPGMPINVSGRHDHVVLGLNFYYKNLATFEKFLLKNRVHRKS